jgi:hypothetical protein
MEIVTSLVIILYNIAISLGVGASSIVIASFVVALWDKSIEKDERALLGVIYVTLRIAMVAILLTVLYLTFVYPSFSTITPFIWALLFILYVNAGLMTLHWIPSKIGPPLQAATWYTLGTLVTVDLFALYTVTWINATILYGAFIVTAIVIVNAFLKYIFSHKPTTTEPDSTS